MRASLRAGLDASLLAGSIALTVPWWSRRTWSAACRRGGRRLPAAELVSGARPTAAGTRWGRTTSGGRSRRSCARPSSGTVRIALLGTAAVVLGCLAVGVVQGSTRSRGLEALVAAGNLGVMAVPEAAVLITLATAWPRTAPPPGSTSAWSPCWWLFAVPTGRG